jgi:hypothetical protein
MGPSSKINDKFPIKCCQDACPTAWEKILNQIKGGLDSSAPGAEKKFMKLGLIKEQKRNTPVHMKENASTKGELFTIFIFLVRA